MDFRACFALIVRVRKAMAMWNFGGVAILVVLLSGAASAADAPGPVPPNYPPAARGGTVDHYFGTAVPAPYQWMENMQDPALHRWVDAENALTDGYLAKIPVRPWIVRRLTELWNYPKETAPDQVRGPRLFFRRNAGLQNQSVLYVRDSAAAAPRVLIDPNVLSPDGSIALADYEASPDGRLLAYALSTGGSDWETIHVMDVSTGKTLADEVRWVKFSNIAWTNDDRGFYYSRYPEPPANNRINQEVLDHKLYYHTLGTPQSADRLIYSRPDLPRWILEGSVSENGRYLFVALINGTATENELYYADLRDAQKPDTGAALKPLYTKNDAEYVPVGVDRGTLYLRTTLDAPRRRIVATTLSDPAPAQWREVVPQGEGVIVDAGLAHGRILVNWQVVATSRLQLYSTEGKSLGLLPLPTLGAVSGLSTRNDSDSIYYGFTSFLYPTTIYRYDVTTAKTETVFRPDVKFDASKYDLKQVFYRSKDGAKVPMFVVAAKDVKLNGENPTVLYGYGGFDITITPRFNPVLPVWLELGGVYAVPNLRGGGVYGEQWHRAGMLGNKQNVFDDFAAAGRWLIAQNYTSPKQLGIQGYSNGGLLTGASLVQHPELFGAAYIGHGVLDMLRYQDFSGGALWAPEYGTANNPEAFKWLYAWSPLQNIKQGVCYPATLITTSWDDDRVVPMHEFKFAAAMQHAQGCGNPILLRTTGATAHDYMPTDKEIAQTADVWAFEAFNLGITAPPPADGSR
ncbi:MAG TPA: prolyl oligopeptidase family serine peptidase [Rhizomicrobium sp.]|jgi:prolyl oligopeptidase|nr:prolyl oligopeptidase family serine peptidase [Rhizomicrobium sp.]